MSLTLLNLAEACAAERKRAPNRSTRVASRSFSQAKSPPISRPGYCVKVFTLTASSALAESHAVMPAWTLAEVKGQLQKAKADLERARKAGAYLHNSPSGGRTHSPFLSLLSDSSDMSDSSDIDKSSMPPKSHVRMPAWIFAEVKSELEKAKVALEKAEMILAYRNQSPPSPPLVSL